MEKIKKIKGKILENKRWIIVALAIAIFVIITKKVVEKEIFQLDSIVYNFLVNYRTDFLNTIFKIITQFGSAIWLITITILCMLFIKEKKYKVTIPINLIVIAVLNSILKNIFVRPRPNELRIIDELGFSFPSGHSMASMAFYGYLIYIIYKNMKNKTLRNFLCIFLSILVLLIGISRIYLGVHYASDVIAGICFSITYLIIMISTGVYK